MFVHYFYYIASPKVLLQDLMFYVKNKNKKNPTHFLENTALEKFP